jgi:hypothetical protein
MHPTKMTVPPSRLPRLSVYQAVEAYQRSTSRASWMATYLSRECWTISDPHSVPESRNAHITLHIGHIGLIYRTANTVKCLRCKCNYLLELDVCAAGRRMLSCIYRTLTYYRLHSTSTSSFIRPSMAVSDQTCTDG